MENIIDKEELTNEDFVSVKIPNWDTCYFFYKKEIGFNSKGVFVLKPCTNQFALDDKTMVGTITYAELFAELTSNKDFGKKPIVEQNILIQLEDWSKVDWKDIITDMFKVI